MNRMRLGGVVLALCVATAAKAQTPSDWAVKMFEYDGGSARHDFGKVPRGAVLSHRFKMTNIWAVPLQIINVRTSCGCVTAKPTKQLLQSKEVGYLEVTMDSRRFTGEKTVSIYVTVGPQWVSTATVQVSANSRPDVVFNPGSVNFGVVPLGSKQVKTIDVEYAGALDWRIIEVMNNGAPLEVQLKELYRRPGQVGYQLEVTLQSNAGAGHHRWDLALRTNDPDTPIVNVLVEATIQKSLQVIPSTIRLGKVAVGESVSRKVVIRSDTPFRIMSLSGLEEGVDVDLPTTDGQVQVLTFKLRPVRAGDINQKITVHTDRNDKAPVVVHIEGTAVVE
ncbi:MAG: hypothetical protein KatS3mg105_2300 [Gemmatales bacterium]|nr:MAG: hypothetical protein KatS3mg105_2300 [Gemmatales bacterium]